MVRSALLARLVLTRTPGNSAEISRFFVIAGEEHFSNPSLSFRDAPLGAGPESILPAGVMDSGLARFARAPE
jgi:hypothetical protein